MMPQVKNDCLWAKAKKPVWEKGQGEKATIHSNSKTGIFAMTLT